MGKQALLRLRDVILHIRGTDITVEEETKAAISKLVEVLNQEGNFKRLSMKWQDRYVLDGH